MRHLRFSIFSYASFVSPIRGNHLLLSSNTWALDYDLERDRPDLLWAFNPVGPDLGMDKARCKDYFGMSASPLVSRRLALDRPSLWPIVHRQQAPGTLSAAGQTARRESLPPTRVHRTP